ncbi:ATP-grasp domain-containing protein [Qipengyuania marisflavi]|uniref:ATP-grasp domain-containing protein n=1 Tax=Qipengyuania marisflavi TaxID=2486356 RepID=A0A5S3P764_9SPHN|nr:ATP-grasp domain-containing protein [Qipengyuania marisflavi]TMM49071.1 hypothetical protein FEV51_06810 [Qipengyuania marisflavi]
MTPNPAAPVLIFGCDTNAFLGTVRSLGRAGVRIHAAGCDAAIPAGQSRYLEAHHEIPSYVGDGSVWAARIAELLRQHDYALLIPTSDSALAQLDAHRAQLGEQRLAIPSHHALALLANKDATRRAAQECGVPVTGGRPVIAGDDAATLAGELGLPLIIKTVRSYAPGDSTQKATVGLFEDAAKLQQRLDQGGDLLAESYVPGFCRGVSVVAKDGAALQAFQHRRLRQEHRTGPSSWRISERLDPQLLDSVGKLIAKTDYTGVAMFEFRCTHDGRETYLLEVNPRFWGSLHLALDAGADYPATLHAMLCGGPTPAKRTDYPAGLEKFSVWGEFDALSGTWHSARGISERAEAFSRLTGYVAKLARKRGFDSWAEDDPAPFYTERRQVLRRLFDHGTGRSAGRT